MRQFTFVHGTTQKEITVEDVSLDAAREQAALKLALVNKYSLHLKLKQREEHKQEGE